MYQQYYQQIPQQQFTPYGQYTGVGYGGRPTPKCTQPVTQEMAKMLNQNADELSIQISNTEKVRNWCTHKEPSNGRIALVDNGDGSVTCRVCGSTFHIIEDLAKDAPAIADLSLIHI